jgi:hypothetical protein
VAGAFTLLSEKVATLFEERVEDGLSDNLAGQDMDTVMGLISRCAFCVPARGQNALWAILRPCQLLVI